MKNNEITIIELLDRIDKEQSIPKKVKMGDTIYRWDNDYKCYINIDNSSDIGLTFDESDIHFIIEILDEQNDEFEDVEEFEEKLVRYEDPDSPLGKYKNEYNATKEEICETFNKLIRNQKKIIERLNKNE